MKPIYTLTLNPAIDGASETDVVRHTHKVRTTNERYDPGGGGINVARVIIELDRPAIPIAMIGGATGGVLDTLLRERGLKPMAIPIAGHTRISHTVFEHSTGREFRFVAEGPRVTDTEWRSCLAAVDTVDCDWLVASGSPPPGLGDEVYAELAERAALRGVRFVLDTSGPSLTSALATGHVHLAKPSLGEFRSLLDAPLSSLAEIRGAADRYVKDGKVAMLAVTMGHDGALLAHSGGTEVLHPPDVLVKSATGAGDSFLGAMVAALASGTDAPSAFRYGIAAGTAAVLTPGTELCRAEDVERLLKQLQ